MNTVMWAREFSSMRLRCPGIKFRYDHRNTLAPAYDMNRCGVTGGCFAGLFHSAPQ